MIHLVRYIHVDCFLLFIFNSTKIFTFKYSICSDNTSIRNSHIAFRIGILNANMIPLFLCKLSEINCIVIMTSDIVKMALQSNDLCQYQYHLFTLIS